MALAKIPDDMACNPEIAGLLRKAADHLADAGYAVSEVDVPDLAGTWKLWCDLLMTEVAVQQEAQMRQLGSAAFNRSFDNFLPLATILDFDGYMKAIAYRSRVLRAWLAFLEEYPLVLTPLSVQPTPKVDADCEFRRARACALLERSAVHVGHQRFRSACGSRSCGAGVHKPCGCAAYRFALSGRPLHRCGGGNRKGVGIMAHRLWERESGARLG